MISFGFEFHEFLGITKVSQITPFQKISPN